MAASRNFSAIAVGLILIAGCFVAGFILVRGNSASPAPAGVKASPAAPIEAPATPDPSLELLSIKKAVYGDLPDGNSVDVTAKVAAMAGKTEFSVDASNDNFGDPAPGIAKKLRVDYMADGVARTRTISEGETIKIHVHAGPMHLVIKKAVYGDLPDGSASNVTGIVAERADNDSLSVAATNDVFGDPASGIVKKLRVDYVFDGKEKSKTVDEGETLAISSAGD